MQLPAMILGLIGGIVGLAAGWASYGIGELARGFGMPTSSGLLCLLAPMTGLIGSSLALTRSAIAAALLLTSAALMALVFGFGSTSAVSILLFLTSALMLLLGTPDGNAQFRSVLDQLQQFKPMMIVGEAGQFRLRGVGIPMQVAVPQRDLTAGITLGRGDDCGVKVRHDSVSRKHARICRDRSGSVVVEDLGSANGTWINDQRITRSQLKKGSTLRLGSVRLFVEEA
jgi:hypothetical protein